MFTPKKQTVKPGDAFQQWFESVRVVEKLLFT
jgi:hypothetical protein